MHSIVYGNLRIEILTDAGSRLERVALQRVTPQLLGRQPTGPAGGELQTPLGREEELGRIRLAIQAGKPIELVAACGFGKTGLLRQLGTVDGGEDLTRPWIYLRLGKEQLDDTLQRLFDASYTNPQPFKPTPEQRAQLLGQVNAVILLDDLSVGAAEIGQLVANLAGASVLVAPRTVAGARRPGGRVRPHGPARDPLPAPRRDPVAIADLGLRHDRDGWANHHGRAHHAPDRPGRGRQSAPAPASAPDTAPPVLRLPSDVVQEATSNLGARVRFSTSATDQVDGAVPITCTPSSGTSFPLGATLVTCSAVDRSGFAAIGEFLVTVLDSRPPALKLPREPDRGGHLQGRRAGALRRLGNRPGRRVGARHLHPDLGQHFPDRHHRGELLGNRRRRVRSDPRLHRSGA
jgi:HYR domain